MNQGEALRRIRVSKGLSQENEASILRINQTSYSEWEHKEFIKEEKLTKIISALGATKEEFNKMADELNPKNTNWGGGLNENILKIIETQKHILIKMAELEEELKRLQGEKGSGNKS